MTPESSCDPRVFISYGDDEGYEQFENYGWAISNSGREIQEVAKKLPNPWGFYDMHGNVGEWCLDWHSVNYTGGSILDPSGPIQGSGRVIRAGSVFDFAQFSRSAERVSNQPGYKGKILGFRIASVRGSE